MTTRTVRLFDKLAKVTWDTIGNAHENRISYGEDAITSTNLLTLKNASLPNLVVIDTRTRESIKGCDFEFWIGNNNDGWFRYAIQAKKIRVSSGRYEALNHYVNSTPQIDILESYARANKAIPLYCLFSYSELPTFKNKRTCLYLSDIREHGCSITPSAVARISIKTRGAKTFEWFHSRSETLPWSCLVRCPQLHSYWPKAIVGHDYNNLVYKHLPESLTLLLHDNEKPSNFIDTNLFSREVEHRPLWVAVINTEEKI